MATQVLKCLQCLRLKYGLTKNIKICKRSALIASFIVTLCAKDSIFLRCGEVVYIPGGGMSAGVS